MRGGMRRKLLTFMCGLVAFVVLFGFALNNLFLERFYIHYKSRTLLRSLHDINQIYGSPGEDNDLELLRMQVEQGIQVIIFGPNLDIRYFALQQSVGMSIGIGFGRRATFGGIDLVGFVGEYARNGAPAYEISRNYDNLLRTEYLDLIGALDNGNYALMRMPIQTITDSVGIANRFLLISGGISLLLSVIISLSLSSQIAKPIRAVEDIARSMSNLDFSRKITVKSRDEIGSLASSVNTLSDRLQETINELQDKNRQLEEDYRYISKLDERRREFLSSVSHELKTPIALIQGYAEALEERVVTSDENRAFYYHVISDEADKMNILVKKLMSLNNLEAGHDELYLESFDAVALVQSVMRKGKTLQGAERLDFQFVGPDEAWVWADHFLIEEVVFNYMTNAINHAGGRDLVRVSVRMIPASPSEGAGPMDLGSADASPADISSTDTSPADVSLADTSSANAGPAKKSPGASPDGGRVRVEVFNSGSYLNDEDRERVWESFYKVDKSRSREYGGSGLGLSVVRAVMELHGSAYGVVNIEDGVSFWFELPASEHYGSSSSDSSGKK